MVYLSISCFGLDLENLDSCDAEGRFGFRLGIALWGFDGGWEVGFGEMGWCGGGRSDWRGKWVRGESAGVVGVVLCYGSAAAWKEWTTRVKLLYIRRW